MGDAVAGPRGGATLEQEQWPREAVALCFAPQNVGAGWKILDRLGISLQVAHAGPGLVYVFSSVHWHLVRGALKDGGIPYRYKVARAFTQAAIQEPSGWLSP